MKKFIRMLGSGKKRRRSSDSSSDSSEEFAGEGLRGGEAGMASRQRRLKRQAEAKPGALMIKGYTLMHEQLGSMYGEYAPGEDEGTRILHLRQCATS